MKRHALVAVAVAAVIVALGSAAEPEIEVSPVSGTITVDGEPLADGRIFFHLKEGQFIGCRTRENGRYKIDRVPTGEYPVTIEGTVNGEPLPDRYSSDKAPSLRVRIEAPTNEINFDLVSR
jgi:hypothetical protein